MNVTLRAPLSAKVPAANVSDADALTEAERARVLAKSALFNPPPHVLPDGRRDIVGLSREQLADEVAAIGEAKFRVKQLWHWIYHQGTTDFSAMSSIARPFAGEAGRTLRDRPPGGGHRADQRGCHPEIPVPLSRRA